MKLKEFIRSVLIFFHLDLTKNLEYDRLTKVILNKAINKDSNCIDVGCHKGEILREIIKLAPNGNQFAFEPIPDLYNALKKYFNGKANIYPYALSDKNGDTTYQVVKNALAYSGIHKRKYKVEKPEIEEINVQLRTLDDVIDLNIKIDFIKIDVEGGEFGVLKGAKKILSNHKPTIIFECGLGASEFYGTDPNELYDYLNKVIGLKLFTLKSFINSTTPLSGEEFKNFFNTGEEYYFVASK